MSYEKELIYGEAINLIVSFEYSLGDDCLKLDKWRLYDDDDKEILVPDREFAEEIENFLVKWLEKEYSNFSRNYKMDLQEAMLEKKSMKEIDNERF